MPTGWRGSNRRETLGPEYFRNRAIVLRRDKRKCQLRFRGLCIGNANQCDHIGDRRDHRPENMRAACGPCHQYRSSQQGAEAAVKQRREIVAARKRPPESHPGGW